MRSLLSFLLFLGFTLPLFSASEEDLSDFGECAKEKILDKRENFFRTSTDYQITPKVNPITGEYAEEEVDLIVAGAEPLSLRRFYNHFSPYDPRYASWRYNPEHFFVANANGMLTNREDAIKQAEYISQTHGGAQVDLLYQGTNGLVMDLIGCGLAKLGIPTSYNKMCANYYQRKLQQDPNHRFTSCVHSRGGIQMMNTGRLLSHDQRQHIDVLTYGSATLIPKGYFRTATNILSRLDVVSMTNPLAYGMGLVSRKQFNMQFLPPVTRSPWREHSLLGPTYAREIERRGGDFEETYFNE